MPEVLMTIAAGLLVYSAFIAGKIVAYCEIRKLAELRAVAASKRGCS